ncbi:MAG: Rab family GTPase [Promethearchaeota archaeon]
MTKVVNRAVDITFKICAVGDKGIGKERFVKSFILESLYKEDDNSPTIGADLYAKNITVDTEEGPKICAIQLWDFSGEERFRFLLPQYSLGSNGIILFFDLANRESFLRLLNWMESINEVLEKDKLFSGEIPILLIGNKSRVDYFAVSPKEINQFIRKHNLIYIETSTKTEEGVVDSFYCITSLMLGVDIQSDYFLSKDIIYHPKTSTTQIISPVSSLTPQDLSILSQKAIFQKLELLEKKFDGIEKKLDDVKIVKLINEKINEIFSSYEVKEDLGPEAHKDLPILVEVQWDDREGPKLINYFPYDSELDFSLSDISEQLYEVSVPIYGQDHILNAEGALINIQNVRIMAYAFFDSYPDESCREGRRNYMFSLIASKISYFQSLQIKQVFMELSALYKKREKWVIKDFWKKLSDIFSLRIS